MNHFWQFLMHILKTLLVDLKLRFCSWIKKRLLLLGHIAVVCRFGLLLQMEWRGLSVWWSWFLQKRLNWSRCCLGCWVGWLQGTTRYTGEQMPPCEWTSLRGKRGSQLYRDHLPWAVRKRLNRSICRLGCGLGWAKGSTSSIVFARWRQCARRQSAASCAKLGSHVKAFVINIYLTIVMLTGLELHKDGKIQNTNCNISSVSKTCNKSEKLNLTWLSFWNPMPVFCSHNVKVCLNSAKYSQ